jgi:hypothetical protein
MGFFADGRIEIMVANYPNRTLTCHQARRWVEDDMAGEMTIICKAKSIIAAKKKITTQRPWKQDEKTVTIIDGMKMTKTGVTAISQAPRSVTRAKSNWF